MDRRRRCGIPSSWGEKEEGGVDETPNIRRLQELMKANLKLPLTPQKLVSFLRKKVHHHPGLTHLDLRVFKWAARVDTFRHDHSSYSWMVRSLASSHRLNQILPLLHTISTSPCPCSPPIFSCPFTLPIFTVAISSLCRASLFPQALRSLSLLLPLLDSKPPASLFNLFIHSFLKRGLHSPALKILNSMHSARVSPDIFTFNLLIYSHCKSSRLDLAMDVFHLMRAHSCPPDVVSFNTLLTGFLAAKKLDRCVEMAMEMVDLGVGVSNATCEVVVGGLCGCGRFEEGIGFLMKLCGRRALPCGFDCGFVVERLCGRRKKGVLEAVRLVKGLWEGGYPPSVVACITLLDGLRKEGEVEEAKGMMEKMLEEGILPDTVTHNCVLEALCERGRTVEADAFRLLAATKGLKPNEVSYKILVSGFARQGLRVDVKRLVDEMLDEGFIPDIATYNLLINGGSKNSGFKFKSNIG